MQSDIVDAPDSQFSDAAWKEVIQAVEGTYAELAAHQDVLEAKNSELEDLRRFMHSVLSSVSELLLVVDKDQRIERCDGAVEAVLGRDRVALEGRHVTELTDEAAKVVLRDLIGSVLLTRRSAVLEVDIRTESGSAPIEFSIAPRLDERGLTRGAVLVGRPVGELRRAYAELERSHHALKETQGLLVRNEKLASLGRLVAGVAHELNNPISFIYANTHALEKYIGRLEAYFEAVENGAARPELIALREELKLDRAVRNLRGAIDGAKDGAERVRDIVEDLRRLSATGSAEAISFDLRTTARVAADWVLRGTKSSLVIRFEEGTPVQATGNPGHVQQVVMNLVQNAIDAVQDIEDPSVSVTFLRRDDRAVLQVTDNGPGIAEDTAAAIFDPFFTTKPVGQGTGLGLSISQKIAQEHGGSLSLANAAPGCTCFELTLPLEMPE